jgi:hypothetical protein
MIAACKWQAWRLQLWFVLLLTSLPQVFADLKNQSQIFLKRVSHRGGGGLPALSTMSFSPRQHTNELA